MEGARLPFLDEVAHEVCLSLTSLLYCELSEGQEGTYVWGQYLCRPWGPLRVMAPGICPTSP